MSKNAFSKNNCQRAFLEKYQKIFQKKSVPQAQKTVYPIKVVYCLVTLWIVRSR